MSYYTRKARVSFRRNGVETHNQATQTTDGEIESEQPKEVRAHCKTSNANNCTNICTSVTGSIITSNDVNVINTSSDIITHSGSSSSNSSNLGRYTNWNNDHACLVSQPWCCIGDLIAFCDKYEFKSICASDISSHSNIIVEVTALLSGSGAPFDVRKRFPTNIRNEQKLWMCIGRCASVEYHLKRILAAFRRPLAIMSTDKRRAAMQNFHLAVNELRLDISARISEVHLYDRQIFENEFHLNWVDAVENKN